MDAHQATEKQALLEVRSKPMGFRGIFSYTRSMLNNQGVRMVIFLGSMAQDYKLFQYPDSSRDL